MLVWQWLAGTRRVLVRYPWRTGYGWGGGYGWNGWGGRGGGWRGALAGTAAAGMVVAGTAVAGTVAEAIGTAVEAIAGNSLEIPRAGLSAVKYWT